MHVDTDKDHLKSKKYSARKISKQKLKKTINGSLAGSSESRQVTLSNIVNAKAWREEFVLDYLKPGERSLY